MRTIATAVSLAVFTFAAGLTQAASDNREPAAPGAKSPTFAAAAENAAARLQLAEFEVAAGPNVAPEYMVLYSVLSDQIREMRRKSALPAVMCLAENNGDGTAQTLPDNVMERLISDNAEANDGLFTLKQATECKTAGTRIVDAETETRAVLVTAGPMEDDMKDLMADCGDFVGGFMRAAGDSDYDFYSVEGGDVARKLGCELAQ